MKLKTGALALSCAAQLFATAALAQSAPDATALEPLRVTVVRRVVVVLPACAEQGPFDGQGVVRQLRTELVEDGIDRVEAIESNDDSPSLARVSFELSSCVPDVTQVMVIVDDLATRKNVRRSVDLSDVRGAVRTRALALAIAELLRASFSELALSDAPPPAVGVPSVVRDAMRTRLRARVGEPVAPRPVVPTPTVPPRVEPVFVHRVGAAIDARSASTGPIATGVRATYELTAVRWSRSTLSLRVDAGGALASMSDPFGSVLVPLVSVGAGALFETRVSETFDAGLGGRIEGGAVWILPRPTVEGVRAIESVHPALAVGALASMRARVGERGWLGIELELGVAPVGPIVLAREGTVDRVIGGSSGATGAARIGAGARF
ncbi:MAG: hypothetical protein JNK05_22145 [Myxococcales bacterium]|nr:hypothetical protein [Myxococcales bacterium]